jgi:hypothetical protein
MNTPFHPVSHEGILRSDGDTKRRPVPFLRQIENDMMSALAIASWTYSVGSTVVDTPAATAMNLHDPNGSDRISGRMIPQGLRRPVREPNPWCDSETAICRSHVGA